MILGIAHEQMAADVLEEVWLPALAGGVRTAGFSRIADLLWRDKHSANVIDGRMASMDTSFCSRTNKEVTSRSYHLLKRK
jgi:hypothetical protein